MFFFDMIRGNVVSVYQQAQQVRWLCACLHYRGVESMLTAWFNTDQNTKWDIHVCLDMSIAF